MSGPKSFEISKHVVFEAYLRVKANKGAAGVDGESIEQFEVDLQGQPLQAVESDVVGLLLPAAGTDGGDPKAWGTWGQGPRRAHCRGQNRADGGGHGPGTGGGAGVPPRLLWISAGPQRVGRGRGVPGAVLGNRLGDRYGHPRVSSTTLIMILFSRRWRTTPTSGGSCCMCSGGSKAPMQRPDGSLLAPGSRQPAGLGDLTVVGEPVHALRVRCLDGPGIPGRPSSSGTAMTWWSTAARESEAHQVREAIADAAGRVRRVCNCIRTRPASCTARTASRRGSHEHTSFTFLGYGFRVAKGPDEDREVLLRLQPGHQRRGRQTHPPGRSAPGGCTCAADRPWSSSHREINPVVRGWINYYGRF